MDQTIVRKTKLFMPWQDTQEETWLEEMSRQGLYLKKAHFMAQYHFIQGQPANYIYRLDFQDSLKPKNRDEYLHMFTNRGWEYLGSISGWQYFRKLAQYGEAEEIFTDTDAKIQKYKRYLTDLGVSLPPYLVVFIAFWGIWPDWMMWLWIVLMVVVSIFTIVTSVNIARRIKHLKAL